MQPIVLIKYGKKKHLKQLVNGMIRFAPTEDYIKLQSITGEKGQGDSDEGKLHISSTRAIMQPHDNPNRQAEIYKLTTPILCPICQSKMKRRFDSKRKCQTRWMCENLECRIGIDKDDTELLQDITEAMNYLIDHPELVHEVAPEAIEPSIETRKINNEIARMLDNIEVDRDAIRKKMLEAVSQKYQDIDSAAYTTQKLKTDLSSTEKLESFSAVTTEKIVKAIILYNNKTIAFILENDQIIRKESTNGSHSKTEGGSSNTADN